jgi:hypothetical protein
MRGRWEHKHERRSDAQDTTQEPRVDRPHERAAHGTINQEEEEADDDQEARRRRAKP